MAGMDDFGFLDGGGESGARMRAIDWSATALGPASGWPRSLKTVVRIVLDSRYAMWLAWGPELTFFCNDAYAPTLGMKQAWAIGAPARRVWAEVWPIAGPRIERVLDEGKATWDERLLLFLDRSGLREETYHTFSYSPLADDLGCVRGMLCVVTEETDRVVGERRTALLGELAKALGAVRTEQEVFDGLARALAGRGHDVPFSFCYLCEPAGGLREVGHTGENAPAGAGAPEAGAGDWPLARVRETAAPVLVYDEELLARLPRGPWDRPAARALLLPLANPGAAAPAGVFVLGLNPWRPFDEAYRQFLELLAGQVSAALASARSWETGRRRAEELAELDRARTNFFSNVSHELRTPLTLMLGPTEAALAAPEAALAGEDLALVHRNQVRLLRLVNSLLDFARIEAGRMQPALERADLAAQTREIAAAFRPAIERAGIAFSVDCPDLPALVPVDRDMWEKIVLNLLSNALKYTRAGEIALSLRAEDGRAVLRVRDTGAGVPAAELPRLFERFHRVERPGGPTREGTGIGLALVRELALLHDGTVDAQSREGEGSVFIVGIALQGPGPHPAAGLAPAARPSPDLPPAAGPGPGPGLHGATLLDEVSRWLPAGSHTPPRAGQPPQAAQDESEEPEEPEAGAAGEAMLLVVDDNADMRAYLRRILGQRWRVVTASDGPEALSRAQRVLPDLVLTDVMMAGLDGLGLLAALRADPRTAAVPVVVLSARAGEEARLDGLRAGADDYLAKPFSARELLVRIETLLALARARREALRREEELRAETRHVLESIHEGWLVLGEDGRIVQANAAAQSLCGLPREELVGADPGLLFPALQARRPGPPGGPPVRAEQHAAATGRWFEITAYEAARAPVLVLRDITERKQAMLALEAADRRKDEFLATLAHELRNPLAPIRTAAELLGAPHVGEEELVRMRAVIRRQTRHMARLLDDLLDVSRIARGRLELKREPVSLRSVIDTAVEATDAALPGGLGGLVRDVPEPDRLFDADPVRLAQILTNLLNNAAKFSAPGAPIVVSAHLLAGELLLCVRDAGIGMTPAQIARAFELFAQFAPVRGGDAGGLGIGLALVRGIVNLHGGTVQACSDGPGQGSEIRVRLPVTISRAAEAPTVHAQGAGARPGSRRPRVLVVDDNIDAAQTLLSLLEATGHPSAVAHTGAQALEGMRRLAPDVVLLDIGLPDLDGYEVARRLRAAAGRRRLTLIAVTGWGQADDLRRAQEAGFDHHLVKPADPDALLRLLDDAEPQPQEALPPVAGNVPRGVYGLRAGRG